MERLEQVGLIVAVLGTMITCLNFYLSFIRYPLHRLRGGTSENYRWMSGIPVFGSLLLWIGAALLWSKPSLAWTAVAISMLDTAGLHWFGLYIGFRLCLSNRPANTDGQ